MAITRAQQFRQMLEDGGMLVQPGFGGKRQGYRGDAAAKAAEEREKETGQKSSRAPTTSRSDPGDNFDRESFQAAQRRGELRQLALNQKADKREELVERFRNRPINFPGGPGLTPILARIFGPQLQKNAFNLRSNLIRLGDKFSQPDLRKSFLTGKTFDANLMKQASNLIAARLGGKTLYDLSDSEQEALFDEVMDARLSGKTDAAGNLAPGFMFDAQGNIISTGNDGRDTEAERLALLAQAANQNQATTPEPAVDPTMFRFLNRGGMVEDAPMGTGIMDLEAARQMMFIGGIAKGIKKGLKGVTRAAKKVFKSPFGKAALLAAPFVMSGGGSGLFSGLKGKLLGLRGVEEFGGKAGLLKDLGLIKGGFGEFGGLTAGGIGSLIGITSLLAALQKPKEDQNFDLENYYETEGLSDFLANLGQRSRFLAEGGKAEPVAKKTMPLLDLDGKEMDFRAEGGFVPIGRMEKADDVPARLSKNEFVFTADAVRNAGDGDVDKGAEVMYNTMKNLEAGGKVSEETQGLDGAKEMFQTAQRLEGVM